MGLRRVAAAHARRAIAATTGPISYDWAYIFGAVCPARDCGAALVLPCANGEAMNLHLAEISKRVAPGAHAVITLDGAGWTAPAGTKPGGD